MTARPTAALAIASYLAARGAVADDSSERPPPGSRTSFRACADCSPKIEHRERAAYIISCR